MAKRNLDAYRAELKEFRTLAHRADQRLRQLKKDSKRAGFENITNWAYQKAMRDIRYWSGEGAHTFDRDAPTSLNQLRAKKRDIMEFLQAPTSTITGTKKMFAERAKNLNEKYGTNFDWEDLGNVFENKEENEFYQKGGVSYLKAVSYMKENEESLLESLEENKRATVRTGNAKVNSMVRDLLKNKGLDFTDLY